MPYTVDYDEEAACIIVTVQGVFDLSLFRDMVRDVVTLAEETGCRHILNDLRAARPTEKLSEIHTMPEVAKQHGVIQRYKRALVIGDKTSNFGFLETVFANRGHLVKTFTDVDDAMEWLCSK